MPALPRLFLACILAATPLFAQEPLFEDVAGSVGLKGVTGARVSFADLDGDGDPDAILGGQRVFLNDLGESGRQFREPGPRFGLAAGVRKPVFIQVGDLNDDGHADVLLGRSTDRSRDGFEDDGLRSEVWLGNGRGDFSRLEEAGLETTETSTSACFVDVNRDGLLDVFMANAYVAYGRSLEAFPDRLFLGTGDARFQDVTKAAGLEGVATPGGTESRRPSYGVAHTDWDGDGWQDLLVMSYGRQWNRLWRNTGKGRFEDVGPATGFDGDADRSGAYPRVVKEKTGRQDEAPFRANGNTFDAAVADFDNDGDMDVFLAEIAHWWAGSSSDRSMLLVNQGPEAGYVLSREPGRIPRQPPEEAGWNQGDLHAGWLDVENDGRLDLLIASSDYPDPQLLRLYHQRADGRFEDWTDRLGVRWVNASQISLGDFDRDGATDILVGTNNTRLTKEQRAGRTLQVGLLRNRAAAAAGNGFVTMRLTGTGRGGANREAIGARVIIHIGDQQQLREVYGGLGHAGHRDDTDCRFGVGRAEVVDRLEVHWPDAAQTVQVFEDVLVNRHYQLVQGRALEVLATD